MSTLNAFYLRKRATEEATRAAIVSLYPNARIEVTKDFIGGVLSDDAVELPEQALSELSAKLETDVIWVTYQTTAESFIYHHWRAGKQLRALWYGCANEGTWERVEGRAEPWERDAFWDDEASGSLKKGQTEPMVSSEDAVHAVMEHYGLFTEESARVYQSSSPSDSRAKPLRRYGCLLILVFLAAVVVFAIIGVVSLFR
jgi:hypothetical protein